jgi:hypothetical protein
MFGYVWDTSWNIHILLSHIYQHLGPKPAPKESQGLMLKLEKQHHKTTRNRYGKKYETCKLQGKRICVPFVIVFKLWKVQSLVNKQLKQGGLKASNF